jgi:NADH-quinone oxidoreductase subunit B
MDAPAPPGFEGEGFFAGKLKRYRYGQLLFFVALPFATSCCGIEFMATMAPNL